MQHYVIAVLAAVVLGGCLANTQQVRGKLGVPFALKPGQTAVVENLQVTFDEVIQDSRCPQGVDCWWIGEVNALFTLKLGSKQETIGLGTIVKFPRDVENHSIKGTNYTFAGYKLAFLSAQPPKGPLETEIPRQDYELTLQVDKAN